jgi:hypothetical protein
MKRILFCLLLLAGFVAQAQVYNTNGLTIPRLTTNSKWKTGLHRIPQSVLASAGLSGTPAEYFSYGAMVFRFLFIHHNRQVYYPKTINMSFGEK